MFCFVFCFVLLESILCLGFQCNAHMWRRKRHGFSEISCLQSPGGDTLGVWSQTQFCRFKHLMSYNVNTVNTHWHRHTHTSEKIFSDKTKRITKFFDFHPECHTHTHTQTYAISLCCLLVHLLLSLPVFVLRCFSTFFLKFSFYAGGIVQFWGNAFNVWLSDRPEGEK